MSAVTPALNLQSPIIHSLLCEECTNFMTADPLVLTVAAQCVLTGAPEALLTVLKKGLTLPNPKYQAAKKYGRWVGRKLPQKLYFYKERKSGFYMPRGYAREAVLQCIELTGQKPFIVDERRQLAEHDFQFQGELREYQERALEEVLGRDFGVLEAGTGSGKTIIALAVIARRKQPVLVIVHTKELLYQWAERAREFLGIEATLIGDGHFEISPFTVAIVNSARNRLDELPSHFGHIVVDECHRVPATLFTDVVTEFDAKYTLGLSATAYRREDVLTRLIYFYMGSCAHKVDAKVLHASGAILKPKILCKPTGFTYRYRDDYAAMMTALTVDAGRNEQIADDVAAAARKKSGILVVSDRIAHCQILAELITARGGRVAILTGRVSAEQRSEIVQEIKEDRVNVLISTLQLIGEGFDAPGLTTLFLATPIKFSGRLKQVIGRILRPASGKQAVVYDYVDEKVSILKNSANQRREMYLIYE